MSNWCIALLGQQRRLLIKRNTIHEIQIAIQWILQRFLLFSQYLTSLIPPPPPPILSGCLLSEKTVWRNDPRIVVRHVNFSVNFRISLLVAILVCTRLISWNQPARAPHNPRRYTRAYLHVCTQYIYWGNKSDREREIREGKSAIEKGREEAKGERTKRRRARSSGVPPIP